MSLPGRRSGRSTPLSLALLLLLSLLALALAGELFPGAYRDPAPVADPARVRDTGSWPHYGGEGGRQYATDALITADTIHRLKPVWSYHTGGVRVTAPDQFAASVFEATPILAQGRLYLCSPTNRVIALDPATGAEFWRYDPGVDTTARYANQLVCRGVSYWAGDGAATGSACASRIFTATNDSRLIALDAVTGEPCEDFGEAGQVQLDSGVGDISWRGQYQHTSPPTVVHDVVVVGGSVSDNYSTTSPSGVVRAFDARSGELIWAQDFAPPGYDHARQPVGSAGYALSTPNVWAPMVADPALNLVYAPTGNPSPDYFREAASDMDYYGSSVVALDADSGDVVWHYQFVHRDVWDFDTPAQPTLFDLERDGASVPALAQGTKMGFVFVLDRRTGEPLFPVEERPVPQATDVALKLSPTQPFPVLPEPVSVSRLAADDAWGLTPWDRGACAETIASLRYEGLYTPPATDWTLMYAGNAGGINWGGVAIDPVRQLLVVNSTNLPWKVRLIPRAQFDAVRRADPGKEISPQYGTDYGVYRDILLSPLGLPCSPPPWGVLTAIDLRTGKQAWQAVLGTTRDLAPVPIALDTGTPSLGGPLLTAGNLTFIGATLENTLRAFDNRSGEEIWRARLPAPAIATPMSYVVKDDNGALRQFIVVAAGGDGRVGTDMSDTLVAFTLLP